MSRFAFALARARNAGSTCDKSVWCIQAVNHDDQVANEVQLSKVERDVLERAEHGRTAADIRFLSGRDAAELDEISTALTRLASLELVAAPENGRFSRTPAGDDLLRANHAWELRVEDTFDLSARQRRVVMGRLQGPGVMYIGDWFVVDEARLGRIVGIDFVCGRDVDPETMSITADISLHEGQVLRGCEPPIAGGLRQPIALDRFEELMNAAASDWAGAELQVHRSEPRDKTSVWADVLSPAGAGQLIVWSSGEADLVWQAAGSENAPMQEHYELVSEAGIELCIDDLAKAIAAAQSR